MKLASPTATSSLAAGWSTAVAGRPAGRTTGPGLTRAEDCRCWRRDGVCVPYTLAGPQCQGTPGQEPVCSDVVSGGVRSCTCECRPRQS